jgi:putative intracellular protease/amidase
MPKRILIVLSEHGYWGEELLGPLEHFDAAGYEVVLATPTGKRPTPLPPSLDPAFLDPPLGKTVTTPEIAEKVKALNASGRLDNPRSLADWLPDRPYWSSPRFIREMEAYYRALDGIQQDIAQYDAVLLIGGSGPIVDMGNNHRVHDLILAFKRAGKLIAAECYGVACLAFARDLQDRQSIIRGKRVTGHCKEYDYKDRLRRLGPELGAAAVPAGVHPP